MKDENKHEIDTDASAAGAAAAAAFVFNTVFTVVATFGHMRKVPAVGKINGKIKIKMKIKDENNNQINAALLLLKQQLPLF